LNTLRKKSGEKIRYPGINLTKEVKDLYNENCKSLNKEDIRRWKDLLCSWLHRINTLKMTILPKITCMFNAVLEISQTKLREEWKELVKRGQMSRFPSCSRHLSSLCGCMHNSSFSL
jgi:hypothetical protein